MSLLESCLKRYRSEKQTRLLKIAVGIILLQVINPGRIAARLPQEKLLSLLSRERIICSLRERKSKRLHRCGRVAAGTGEKNQEVKVHQMPDTTEQNILL